MKTSSFALAAAAAAAMFALSAAAPKAAIPRLVIDPEKKVLEKKGWTYIGISDGVLIYMKDAVPGSAGGARRVLTAYEALEPKEREGFAFRSVQSLGEFDCANGRTRVVQETFYQEPSLKGKAVSRANGEDGEWSDVVQGSVGLMRIVFACRDRPVA